MVKSRSLRMFAACVAAVAAAGLVLAAEEQAPEVTLKGNVLCNRATLPAPWDGSSQDADHVPVLYAVEGTPEVEAAVARILTDDWPDRGLDVEAAQKVLADWTESLRYFIAPGPLTDKIHKDTEWGSQLLALTGTVYEKDGRRWISVTKYEPATVHYPAKMLAPDKPFEPAGAAINLKVGDSLTLDCVLLPAGRFLQGSPFYQQRYQDEYPHEVVLTKDFYMSVTPVTQAMFEAVMGRNPSANKNGDFAVEHATYADIKEWCRRVGEANGRTVRLPTDAEWEYAARVGTSNPCFKEKYADQISQAGTGKADEKPVRTMQPNAWGLYDMLSGGWHMTSDYKADNVRTRQVDQTGPVLGQGPIQMSATGPMHKSRGGFHYSFIRPNMHGAVGEDGTIWEGGAPVFRVVVEE